MSSFRFFKSAALFLDENPILVLQDTKRQDWWKDFYMFIMEGMALTRLGKLQRYRKYLVALRKSLLQQ